MTTGDSPQLPCRRLPWYRGPAGYMLAGAEALLAAMPMHRTAALRWYTLTGVALSLGAGQALDTLDARACAASGVTVYRRAAGGTTVLLDGAMLGLDLALPAGHPLLLADLTRSYQFIGSAWARTLRRFAIRAELVDIATAREAKRRDEASAPPARLVCYGSLSPYEVTVGGRKLVGLAQVRRRHGALFQASLLYASGTDLLSSLLCVPEPERLRLREVLDGRIVGLADLVSDPPPVDAVATAFQEELAGIGLALEESGRSAYDQQLTEEIYAERYRPLSLQEDRCDGLPC